MTDFRDPNFRDPNDQFYGKSGYEPPNENGNRWGWIVGAAFLVVVLGLAFSVGHQPTRVASNDCQRWPYFQQTRTTQHLAVSPSRSSVP